MLLGTKDLKWQMEERQTEKLMERFMGPYKVKRIVLANTVELELLKTVRIHPVVNVSRIQKYRDQVTRQKKILPPPVIIEGKEEYEVEKILNKRRQQGRWEYLVW